MEGIPDGTLIGKEFLHHTFYPFTKTSLLEVKTKDVLAAVELLKA